MSLFLPLFLKDILTRYGIWSIVFLFFHYFEDFFHCPPADIVSNEKSILTLINSKAWKMPPPFFNLWFTKIFLFITDFQQFDFMSLGMVSCVCSTWGLLSFMGLWVYNFLKIWKNIWLLFHQKNFCSPHLEHHLYLSWIIWYSPIAHRVNMFIYIQPFCSLCFSLNNC